MAPSKSVPESTNQKERTGSLQAYTSMQAYLLERLAQLVQRRNEVAGQLVGDQGPILALLHRAIFAAYVDCLEEGVGEEALEILRGESLAAAA